MKMRILAALMLVVIIFTGCGKDAGENSPTPTTSSPATSAPTPDANAKSKYYFEYNDVKIYMNDEAKPILDKLGEPMSYFESPSCAFQGMDRIYSYSGFDIYTYTDGDDGPEYIFTVAFMSDAVSTTEGISIGDKVDKVVSQYGEDYKESSNQYVYSDQNSKLSFLIESGEVTAIEYNMILAE